MREERVLIKNQVAALDELLVALAKPLNPDRVEPKHLFGSRELEY